MAIPALPTHGASWDGPGSWAAGIDAAARAAVLKWQPSTAYTAGDVVINPSGQTVTANATFTSGTSYSASNWTVVSGTGGGGTVTDATTTAKGVVQLAGDLAGTAAAPTVPGLAAKAPTASPTFTGTVSGVTKAMVGLGNVDNTADTAKPVSTAQQSAIDTASTADRARANHTGTQSADTLTDGTTNKAFLATERTKLTGVATGATANATDAQLRDRSTHTGTQAISTVTGLQTAIDAKLDTTTAAATYVAKVDAIDLESTQDSIAGMFTGGTHSGISFTYNDPGNVINATVTATGGGGSGTVAASTVRGVTIPGGSLDVWRAALANHATDRPEVVILGDSTWWGEVSTGDANPGDANYNVNNYSPVARLRELAAASGVTDGGPGLVGLFDSAPQLGLPVRPVDAGYTASQAGAVAAMLNQYSPALSGTQTVTYRTRTTQARFWVWASGDSGSFTYKVNSGSAVTVTPGTGGKWSSTLITGMTAGVDNTITFTNVSGTNRVDVEFLNATGVVFHKTAVPGATVGAFIASPDESTNNNYLLQAILGTDQSAGASSSAEAAHPAGRKVRLAIWLLGLNDLTGISSQGSPRNAESYLNAANVFIQAARAAGADPLICIPHWKVNVSGTFSRAGAMMSSGLASLAAANGCALVDMNEALGGPMGKWSPTYFTGGDAHLKKVGYQQLGTWLWNNVLSLGVTLTPDTSAPSAPTNLASPAHTSTTADLTWTASTDNVGVASYNAYNGATLLQAGLQGTSATLTGLTGGTTYVITLKALDAAGNLSAASNSVSVTTTAADTTPPTAPSNLAAGTPTVATIPLTWTASTDAVGVTGYNAYNSGVLLQAGLTGTAGTLTGLAAGTSYTLTLKAYDAAGNLSAASNTLTVSTASAASSSITDDFNRANSATLGTTATGGKTWTKVGGNNGSLSIASNAVLASTFANNVGAGGQEIAWVDCGSGDGTVQWTVGTSNGTSGSPTFLGAVLRFADSSNFIFVEPINDHVYFRKYVAGTQSFAGSPNATTINPGSVISVKMTGTTFTTTVDGVSLGNITITNGPTNTKHGLCADAASVTADNWSYTP